VARFRSAVTGADALPTPDRASWLLSVLLLVALLAAGCSAAAVRDEPSKSTEPISTTSQAAPKGKATNPGHKDKATGGGRISDAATRAAVDRAWANSKTQFYEAALHDEPEYRAFLSTLVAGGPVYTHSIAYLSGLATEGLVGPKSWRLGNEGVVSLTATRARVDGCLWDTGSVWKASHQPAPASLGGGSGFAASHALLVLEHGRWLVLQDSVTAVTSNKEAGPCHGF
jgi:hypothetical protein